MLAILPGLESTHIIIYTYVFNLLLFTWEYIMVTLLSVNLCYLREQDLL